MSLRVPGWMIAFWVFVFACAVASGEVGAIVLGDTTTALLLELAALVAVVPMGIGLLLWRRDRRAVWLAGLNLVVSLGAGFLALFLDLNIDVRNLVRGPPLVVAVYEGTQNWLTLTLRPEGKMDLYGGAWPGAKAFETGTYEWSGTDLVLKLDEPERSPIPDFPERASVLGNWIHVVDTDGRTRPFRIVLAKSGTIPGAAAEALPDGPSAR